MRITLLAVGRMKAVAAQDLYQLYAARLRWPIAGKEVEERRSLPPEASKEQAGAVLLAALPRGVRAVDTDVVGTQMASRLFATLLGRWMESGTTGLDGRRA